jgi:hypothetical protein
VSVTASDYFEVCQLVFELGFRNDHRADTMHELVAEDYTSTGPMGGMNGRAALAAWGAKRVTNPSQVRHVVSNVRVFEADGVLSAISYYVAFRDSGANPGVPASMGEYHDTFTRVDGELRFASRKVVPVFVNADAPRPEIGGAK